MNILITGGTGLIGQALCKALLARGDALTVLSRNPASVAAKCGPAVKAIGALSDWQVADTDAVISLAGAPILNAAWTAKRKQLLVDSRANMTRDLVQRMAQSGVRPKTLLSGSAIGFYGEGGDRLLDESAAVTAPDFLTDLCAAWEAAAKPAEALGVRTCLLRTGLVMSAKGGLLGLQVLPFKLGLGTRLGNGRQWMSWIHIDDFINLLLFLLDNPNASGPYNMTAPTPVTNADFTAALGRALHRPALFVAPAFVLNAALGERAPMLLGSQRVPPARALAAGFKFAHPALDGALADLLRG